MMHTSPAHKTFLLLLLLSLLCNSFRCQNCTLQQVHVCSTGEVAASCEFPNKRRSFNNLNTNDKGAVLHRCFEAASSGRDLESRGGDVPGVPGSAVRVAKGCRFWRERQKAGWQ
jgi:hypothetical protein